MARRRTFNRKRNSRRKSIDSVGSGHLDPDTSVVDEEQTFWWNHLQENTFPPHSLIHSENETARQLSVSSRVDSGQGPSEWWKNLEQSGSEPGPSTSPKRKLSAAIVKTNILQSSTSESEKELDIRKRKVRLRAANRKSVNNAFLNALDNTEVSVPLKLRMKRAKYSDLYTDSDKEVSQKSLQENEEDSSNISSTENILKSKPSIYRRREEGRSEDQKPFKDILTQDVSNSSTTGKSVVLEKEFSKRSMHRYIDASKDNADEQRKSTGASQIMPLEIEPEVLKLNTDSSKLLIPNAKNVLVSNANEIIQSSDDSDSLIINKRLKLKSRFMQRARKSIGRNAFADALADDSSSTSNPNKENDIHESPLMSQSSLSPSKRSVNRSKTKINITHESSLIRRSPKSSLNTTKKQSLDVPVQAKDNIEINSSSSSLDSESRKKTSVFLKPKSRILKSLRKSQTKNAFAEIFEEDDISARKTNVSTKDNRVSVERGETTTWISQVHGSLTTDKSPQLKEDEIMSEEDSCDISLTTSNVEKSISNKSNVSENKSKLSESDFTNASKSISRKSVVAKTPEKQISSSRKSTREETLKEHTNAVLPVNSTNEMVTHEIINDDLHDDIDIEQDSSISKRMSKSNPKETSLTRNSLRNRSETSNLTNIEVHEVVDNLHNDANRERDSSTSKRASKSSPDNETRLTRNSLRNRSETPNLTDVEVHKVVDNLHNDANRERDSSISKRASKSSPDNETRLTRNSLRNRSETPNLTDVEVHKVADNLHNDANRERDSSMSKRASKSSPDKETRLTRNSLRNRTETPNLMDVEVHEVVDNLHNDANRERDSSMSKRASKSSPGNETRLTRNSLRNRSETPNLTDVEVHKVADNLHNDANRGHDSSMSKRASKSSPKETRLTRNSLRNRSETPNLMDVEVHEIVDNLHNDANRGHDSSMSKRASKSSPDNETRLTRNSLRNRSETSNLTDVEVHKVADNLHNDVNRERDSSMSKRASKSSSGNETRLTRNSLRNRSETPKPASKNIELPKQSVNWIADIEEVDNVNADSEKNIDDISQISSTKISQVSANIGTHKSAIHSAEMEITDEDADSDMQVIQRNSISTKAETSNKAVNRQSVQSSNRTSIKENRETGRQRILNKSHIYHSTSAKSPSKDTSFSVRPNSFKSLKIDDFFKVKHASTTVDKQSSDRAQNLNSQIFDAEKMKKLKTELEKIKNREMAAMKIATTDKKESALKANSVKPIMFKQATKKKQPIAKPKVVDKAFLVNGKVYKAPRLPRPKYWATDRLYKFLWNRMEPKYKLATRLKSEKFVQELAKMVSVIERRKNYENYKTEMDALMKEMARLKIINTRSDFYHFCQDFLPYEFRVKVVPMLLPGNKRNIPYDPKQLYTPLLDT